MTNYTTSQDGGSTAKPRQSKPTKAQVKLLTQLRDNPKWLIYHHRSLYPYSTTEEWTEFSIIHTYEYYQRSTVTLNIKTFHALRKDGWIELRNQHPINGSNRGTESYYVLSEAGRKAVTVTPIKRLDAQRGESDGVE